jgi:tetratricopeptide (TPR) repeat protein
MEARLPREAFEYWVKAGRLAHARWANREAADFFERALRVLASLPESDETLRHAIDLRFDLKTSLTPLGAFDRIISHLREAESLARRLGDQNRLAQFSVHMCQTLGFTGNPKEAIVHGKNAQVIAYSLQDIALQVAATHFLGTACYLTESYQQAEHNFLQVLRLLPGELSRQQFALSAYPAVTARSCLTRIYAEQGNFSDGIAHGEAAIRLAESLDHPYCITTSLWGLADLHIIKGEIRKAIVLLERGVAVAREWELPFMVAGCSGSLGYAYSLLGRSAEGLPLLEDTLRVFEAMGHRFGQSLFLVPLGEAYLLADRPADALKISDRALTLARESGQGVGEASARRLLGDVFRRSDSPDLSEGHYTEALAIAEELNLRPLVAHCYLGLGKLFLQMGARDRAINHLSTAATRYHELDLSFWPEQAAAIFSQIA